MRSPDLAVAHPALLQFRKIIELVPIPPSFGGVLSPTNMLNGTHPIPALHVCKNCHSLLRNRPTERCFLLGNTLQALVVAAQAFRASAVQAIACAHSLSVGIALAIPAARLVIDARPLPAAGIARRTISLAGNSCSKRFRSRGRRQGLKLGSGLRNRTDLRLCTRLRLF